MISKNSRTFALAFEQRLEIDSLAQLVEHNTFNVGVMGSSPMRVTWIIKQLSSLDNCFLFMALSQQGAPYQGLHQQISIYIRRKTDNSLVNQTIIAKFAPILQGVEVHI